MSDDIGITGSDPCHEAVIEAKVSDSSMEDIIAFVECELEGLDVSIKQVNRSMVVLDEICSNIFNYSQANVFRISIRKSEEDIIFTFMDDGKEFDPLAVEDVDVSASVEQRDEGGLGILISKSLSKSIYYERMDGKNIVTLTLGPQ